MLPPVVLSIASCDFKKNLNASKSSDHPTNQGGRLSRLGGNIGCKDKLNVVRNNTILLSSGAMRPTRSCIDPLDVTRNRRSTTSKPPGEYIHHPTFI